MLRHLFDLVDRYAGPGCLLILLGYLFGGGFPFDRTPRNGVGWIESSDGLRFSRGSVLGPPGPAHASDGAPCSIEIWAHTSVNRGSSVLLSFFRAGSSPDLTVEQAGGHALWVHRQPGAGEIWLERHLSRRWILITLASGAGGSRLYVNGIQTATSSGLRSTQSDCRQSFILGSGASSDSPWHGDLLGLALYEEELKSDDVARHYFAWRANGRPVAPSDLVSGEPQPSALYLFDERSGDVVNDRTDGGRDLAVPESFEVPLSAFLGWPGWAEIRARGLDWRDILVNVLGFMPFGFFLYALVSSGRFGSAWAPVLLTILGGVSVSLLIEVGQFWLPTRTSSLVDVLTNSIGAASGLFVYRLMRRHWL